MRWPTCGICGASRPTLVDGHCPDEWCGHDQRSALTDAQALIAQLSKERDDLERQLARANDRLEAYLLDEQDEGASEREACAALVLALHMPLSLDEIAAAIRARSAR